MYIISYQRVTHFLIGHWRAFLFFACSFILFHDWLARILIVGQRLCLRLQIKKTRTVCLPIVLVKINYFTI